MTQALSRTAAVDAVRDLGWSYVLGKYRAFVAVMSHAQGVEVATIAVTASGADVDDHLAVDLRFDRVELALTDRSLAHVTEQDADLAARISAALAERDFALQTATIAGERHGIQELELAIDALDIPAIRPFWKAVLGYVDEPGHDGPTDALVDPQRIGPALWFQQMDAPRPQRNRIHFDITVPHEEAEARVQAALGAGGTLVTDEYARAFWVLADPEGNEICVCTWQDRE